MRKICATIVVVLAAASAAAQQGRPLPAFAVASATGTAVSSAQLNSTDRWLLVYVEPGSVAGERLVRSLDEWAAAADGVRVVVISAGDVWLDKRAVPTNASLLSFYTDPDGNVSRSLGLVSAPALAGVANGVVDWIVQGVLNDPHMVEPVVRSWFGRRQ
jgi:hypothetical protein